MKLIIVIVISFLFCSCNNSHPTSTMKQKKYNIANSGTILFKIDNETITLKEFNKWKPIRLRNSSSKSQKIHKKMLQGFLKYRIILKMAREKGYHKKDEIIRLFNNKIVELYIKDHLYGPMHSKKPNSVELLNFYKANIRKFTRPLMKHFYALVINCSHKEKSRCEDLKKVVEGNINPSNFRSFVKKYSNDPFSRRKGGDLGFIIDPKYKKNRPLPKGIERKAIEKAFLSKKIGSIFHIKTEEKYYFFLVKRILSEKIIPFQKQKGKAMYMMRKYRQKSMSSSFYKKVQEYYKIHTNQKNINSFLTVSK